MSALSSGKFESLLRFVAATQNRIQALTECQKHEGATRMEIALSCLYSTVREQAPVHGYLAELILPPLGGHQ